MDQSLWQKIKPWLEPTLKFGGIIAGVLLVDSAVPGVGASLLGAGIWEVAKDALADPESPEQRLQLDALLTRPEERKRLAEALLQANADQKIAEGLAGEPALGKEIWEAYTRSLEQLRQEIQDSRAELGELRDILTRASFTIAVTWGQISDFLRGFMPHQIIERPEFEPTFKAFNQGNLRQLVVLGRPLSGKSFLALKLALEWLKQPDRLLAFLDYSPSDIDIQALNALDVEKTLVIYDADAERTRAISPQDAGHLLGLGQRVVVCQRIGQPASAEEEKRLLAFLAVRKFSRIVGREEKFTWPVGNKVRLTLGPINRERTNRLLKANLEAVALGELTLTDDGAGAIYKLMQTLPFSQETSLLGLAKAFMLAALTRKRRSMAGQLELDEEGVRQLTRDLRVSADDVPGLEEGEIIRRIFRETVGDDEKRVLLVLARWQRFLFSPVAPLVALRAGHKALYDRDLVKDDWSLLGRLEQATVLIKRQPGDYYLPWHAWQLEFIEDVDWEEDKNKWFKESLAWLLNNVVKPAGWDEAGLSQVKTVAGLAWRLQEVGFSRETKALHGGIYVAWRNSEQRQERADSAISLGILLARLGLRKGALKYYKEALGLYRRLAQENSKIYLPHMALIANNLGNLLSEMGELTEAKKLCEEALGIYRPLAKKAPKVYLPGVAMAANNLGNILRGLGKWADAKKFCKEALGIYRHLAKKAPKIYLPDVAMAANNLGTVLSEIGALEEAKELHKEALTIRRRLAQEKPKVYLADMAMSANNLGAVLYDMGELTEARKLYEESLDIRRRLAQENPKAYLTYVVATANNLGLLLGDLGDRAEARKLFEETLDTSRQLVQDDPKAHLHYLATTAHNFSGLLLDWGQWADAAPLVAEAVVLHIIVLPAAPPVYVPRLGLSIGLARRLYHSPDFLDKETWQTGLKEALTKAVGEANANMLISAITMPDSDFQQLQSPPKPD